MKKFARFLLILIFVSIMGGVIGYMWLDNEISPVYTSTTQLYVVPGETSEASLRASDGGLKEDFAVVFKSNLVITDAQKSVGTSEDLSSYITVNTPNNSNIIEIICTNPAQTTAKQYVDAVAKSALKTTTIIPVEKLSILSEGTSSGISSKPDLYRYTAYITIASFSLCLFIEFIVVLFISAFKRNKEEDDEAEYNRHYGNVLEYNDNSRKTYTTKEMKKAEKQSAVTLDNDLLLDEPEIEGIEVDILNDIQTDDQSNNIEVKSSSDVIGKIPR